MRLPDFAYLELGWRLTREWIGARDGGRWVHAIIVAGKPPVSRASAEETDDPIAFVRAQVEKIK